MSKTEEDNILLSVMSVYFLYFYHQLFVAVSNAEFNVCRMIMIYNTYL